MTGPRSWLLQWVFVAIVLPRAAAQLGEVQHAPGPLHAMDRAQLEAELLSRGAQPTSARSDGQLRKQVSTLRRRLSEHRDRQFFAAQTILHEVELLTENFLTASSLDTILADDNAVLSEAFGTKLLWQVQVQAAAGTALGLLLWKSPLLGRIPASRWSFGATTVATSAGLAAIAAAREFLRGREGVAPSHFGQKLVAMCCRQALVEHTERAALGGPPTSLLRQRGVLLPIAYTFAPARPPDRTSTAP